MRSRSSEACGGGTEVAICKRRNISLDGEAAVIRLPTILGGNYRYRRGSRSVHVRIARKFSRMPTCHHHCSTLLAALELKVLLPC